MFLLVFALGWMQSSRRVEAGYVMPALPNGVYAFYINTASFVQGYSGQPGVSGLTEGDWEKWILHAVSIWVIDSGADISMEYLGRTTAACNNHSDGRRVIGARYIAATNPVAAVSPAERDLCANTGASIFVAPAWSPARADLIGTLVHEVGHILGLGHYPEGVMRDILPMAGIWHRSLAGADVDLVVGRYGAASKPNIHSTVEPTPPVVGTAVYSPANSTARPVGSALGDHLGQTRIARAAVTPGDGAIRWDWDNWPLATTGTFTHSTTRSLRSLYAPALATDTWGRWITVVPMPREDLDVCAGYRIWRTDNLFASLTTVFRSDLCTSMAVGVAYLQSVGVWIMVYVGSFRGTPSRMDDTGRILLRTSVDGLDFLSSTEIELPAFTFSPPSIACGPSSCMVGFVDGSTVRPTAAHVHITGGPSGVSVGEIHVEGTNFTSRTPHVAYFAEDLSWPWTDGSFVQSMWWSGTLTELANGRARAWLSGTSGPDIVYTWSAATSHGSHPPAIASSWYRLSGYLLWSM